MNEQTENLVLEHLRPIHEQNDRMAGDISEIKQRLGILENQYANLSNRLDRMDERVERIENRLELREPAHHV